MSAVGWLVVLCLSVLAIAPFDAALTVHLVKPEWVAAIIVFNTIAIVEILSLGCVLAVRISAEQEKKP